MYNALGNLYTASGYVIGALQCRVQNHHPDQGCTKGVQTGKSSLKKLITI